MHKVGANNLYRYLTPKSTTLMCQVDLTHSPYIDASNKIIVTKGASILTFTNWTMLFFHGTMLFSHAFTSYVIGTCTRQQSIGNRIKQLLATKKRYYTYKYGRSCLQIDRTTVFSYKHIERL